MTRADRLYECLERVQMGLLRTRPMQPQLSVTEQQSLYDDVTDVLQREKPLTFEQTAPNEERPPNFREMRGIFKPQS